MFYTALIAACTTFVCFKFRSLTLITAIVLLVCAAAFAINKRYAVSAVFVICFCIMLRMLSAYSDIDKVDLYDGSYVNGTFVVTEDSETDGSVTRVTLKAEKCDCLPCGMLISAVSYSGDAFLAGDITETSVKISKFKDYNKSFWYGEDVFASGALAKETKIVGTNPFYGFLGSVRRYINRTVFNYLGGDNAAALIAVLTGNKTFLSDMLKENIKKAGVSHLVAVSGLHLSILLGGIFKLYSNFFKNKYIKFAISALSVFFIAGVCGFTKSIVRAGIMFVFAAAAPLFERGNDSLNTLGTAVTAVILFSPFAVLSTAFELSVAATFAIIYLVPFYTNVLCGFLCPDIGMFKSIISALLNTILASLATMPVCIMRFGYISTVSLITNILLNYAVTGALLFTAAAVILPGFCVTLKAVGFLIAGLCSKYMQFIINTFADLPFSTVNAGTKTAIATALIFTALTAVVKITDIISYKKGGNRFADNLRRCA